MENQKWRWMEDDFPFQLGDFFLSFHVDFPGCKRFPNYVIDKGEQPKVYR